jgi:glycosyltransferase involved in cell wall biosynthesis
MKVLFVGVYASQELVSRFNKQSNKEGSISVAAIKYTRLIGEGFKYNIGSNSTNLFLVPIGMYPVCKIKLWSKIKIEDNHYIPFINFIIIKQLSITLYLFYFSIKWYFQNIGNEKKIIVFSFLYLPFLIAIAPLRLLKNIYITSFVPDMPEYEFSYSKTKFSLKKGLVPLYIYISNKIVGVNDYFVYITKYMKDIFGEKPYQVIEGFTDAEITIRENEYILEKKGIMYAGALFEKFGLKILLDAFIEIEGDFELWLFGTGDMEKEIQLYSLKDTRVRYFGNRPNGEILEFEKKAKLLVNPRFSDNEFTKYSFPSKLMEYMSSGTPVLTTKLPGIPDDYHDKMYYIGEETTLGLKESMLRCLSKPQKELDLFGANAKAYVLDRKNNYIQINVLIKAMDEQL